MRVRHLHELWSSMAMVNQGPLRIWLGGLFQPGAFLTATRQRTSRSLALSLEKLTLEAAVGADEGRSSQPGGFSAEASACQFLVERCMLHAARWDREKGCLDSGSGEAVALPPLVLRWREASGGCAVEDSDEGASMVHLPMYLNSERGSVLCSVQLPGQSEDSCAICPPLARAWCRHHHMVRALAGSSAPLLLCSDSERYSSPRG